MTIYLSRSFTRSNSSFFLTRGSPFKSFILCFNKTPREDKFLVDTGLGGPRICIQDELIRVPKKRGTRFENEVGFLDRAAGKSRIKIRKHILVRYFINVVLGEPQIKERTTLKLRTLLGTTGVVDGEPPLLNPRGFRHRLVFIELRKIRRTNTQVKGFYFKKLRRRKGYMVAIAGFRAFISMRLFKKRVRERSNDRFIFGTNRKSKFGTNRKSKPKRRQDSFMNNIRKEIRVL
uniref:Ribosomal protein S1 n=1 Tax=Hypseocharis bilobata TaxID=253189 RepID=A0A0G3B9E2_9ROSI|nr:ribosomal protein S1 [Hypseocharis bilobata]